MPEKIVAYQRSVAMRNSFTPNRSNVLPSLYTRSGETVNSLLCAATFSLSNRQSVNFRIHSANTCLFYRIVASFGERMTAHNSPESHPTPFEGPIFSDCLNSILRTCGIKTTCRWKKRGYVPTIQCYAYNKDMLHDDQTNTCRG